MKSLLVLSLALFVFHGCEKAKHSSLHMGKPVLEKVIIAEKTSAIDAKTKFCQDRTSSTSALQKLLSKEENALWFLNRSGFMQSGVCWWYSRFMRAAAYLAIFDASLPKPTNEEAKKIIDQIRKRESVVIVPGFSSLIEFSSFYEKEILSKLTTWMRSDALLKVAWISGLTGSARVSSDELEKKMNELYERIKRGEVVYQKLQMPGLAAHSWLVIGMEPTLEGYELKILDSNMYNPQTYTYTKGMRSFDYHDAYFQSYFVPYTEQEQEEVKLKEILLNTCK